MKKKIPDTKIFSSKLVFVGGLSRCGKAFLCPIVSSFKNSEMFICEPVSENIYHAHYLKKIDYDLAKFFLKRIYNERIYNLNIGRNLNKKVGDYSSITKFKDPKIYFERENSGKNKSNKNFKSNSFYPIMFHDVMLSPQLILDSFRDVKIIYIDRHPVDIIIEWIKKGYDGKHSSSKKNTGLSFYYKNKFYPYWWFGNEKNFFKIKNKLERIILVLKKIYIDQKINFIKFKKRYPQNFFYVNYDVMTSKTDHTIKKIIKFLNTKNDKNTFKIVKRENGNREIDINDRFNKRDYIVKRISKKYLKILNNLEKTYEKKI